LRKEPACQRLLAAGANGVPRDCQDLEHELAFGARLSAVRTYQGPRDALQRRELESNDAKLLLDCLCHGDPSCTPPSAPLQDESYRQIIDHVLANPQRQTELVCWAWAAGAMQAHKAAEMTLGEAMRCAFDDPTVPAERVSVATLEVTTCY
jgi:hypothetical protein